MHSCWLKKELIPSAPRSVTPNSRVREKMTGLEIVSDMAPIDTALEIAEDVVTVGDVVAKVAESLHDLSPVVRIVVPPTVTVELLGARR